MSLSRKSWGCSNFIFAALLCSFLNDFRVVGEGANFATSHLFEAEKYADVARPRGMILDSAGDILVLGSQQISVFHIVNGEIVQNVLVDDSGLIGLGLNHGIAIYNNFLYASSATTVYRWPYTPGSRRRITVSPQIVVTNMPYGGYDTRTLMINKNGTMYISVGSRSNADRNVNRSLIKHLPNVANISSSGIDYSNLPNFAEGLRNTVGLAFDDDGVLWGVDNGMNDLSRSDLGPDIQSSNPADELNVFRRPGDIYGHPYCFTADNLVGNKSGQYAHPKYMTIGINDTWCNATGNVNNIHPVLNLPAHNAPLGIHFYDGKGCGKNKGSFPCSAKGDAFIAFHGSRNRDVPDGYFVGWLPFNNTTRLPSGEIQPVIYEPNSLSCSSCFRPVSIVFNNEGHLIVSSDATNEIFRVFYTPIFHANSGTGNHNFNFTTFVFNFLIVTACKMLF